MNSEKRSLLAVALSVAVFLVWYSFFAPKPVQRPSETKETEPTAQQAPLPAGPSAAETGRTSTGPSTAPDPQAGIPLKKSIIESELYRVELTNEGGIPVSWTMKKFLTNKEKEKGLVNLVAGDAPVLLESFSYPNVPPRPRYNVIEETPDRVVYGWRSKDIAITKTYQFDPKSYMAEVTVAIRNLGQNPIENAISTEWATAVPKEEKRGFFGFLKGPQNVFNFIYYLDGKIGKEPVTEKSGQLLWAGVEDRYFLSVIVPRGYGDSAGISSVRKAGGDGAHILETRVTVPAVAITSGQEAVQKYSVYVGPKEMNSLKLAGASLDKAIDYGWFGFIAVPILYLLKFFYGLIHNYGVAIILLTVFVKLLLNPLSHHSMKSMKAMQQLQPKMKELKEKYKNDKERLNMETMALFRAHKVNPMGGCLPMLVQLPIYIALYKVLWNSIELYRAPFFFIYKDLSLPDPYFIMPVLLGVAMFFQQKLTPSASADPAQVKMMQIMPVMFTAFMLFLPSGLVLYILVNTVMGIAQQYMMNNDIRFRDVLKGNIRPLTKRA